MLKTYRETGLTVGIETVGDADFPTRAAAAVRERCQGDGIDTHDAPAFRTIHVNMFGLP